MSSSEAEAIELGRAAKATLRVKSVLVACRVRPVSGERYYAVTDALRLAVARGSSAKLGHFRVHAATCFRFHPQLHVSLRTAALRKHEADIMTKVLSPRTLRAPEEVVSCSCTAMQLMNSLVACARRAQ